MIGPLVFAFPLIMIYTFQYALVMAFFKLNKSYLKNLAVHSAIMLLSAGLFVLITPPVIVGYYLQMIGLILGMFLIPWLYPKFFKEKVNCVEFRAPVDGTYFVNGKYVQAKKGDLLIKIKA